MANKEDEEGVSRYLLPPLLYGRTRTSSRLVSQAIEAARHKKTQLEAALNRGQDPDPLELTYVKTQQPNDPEPPPRPPSCDPQLHEQMLARGSIDGWGDRSPPRKSRLLYPERFSTQPGLSKDQFQTPVREDSEGEAPLPEKRYKRCATEQKQSLSTPHQSLSQIVRTHVKQEGMPQGQMRMMTLSAEPRSARGGKEEVAVQQLPPKPLFGEEGGSQSHTLVPRSRSRTASLQVSQSEGSGKLVRFYQAIYTLKKSTKTNQRLERAVVALEDINAFFKKIQRVIGVCLLRIGKVLHRLPHTLLYQAGTPYGHFYILLHGKVKLQGPQLMQKLCETGETLLQEVIFDTPANGEEPVALEKAKIVEESWLLRVDIAELGRLQRELVKYGFKRGLIELKNLIKRNQIVKNWVRNKFRLINNQ